MSALCVAVKNGVQSFRDYYEGGHDPMTRDALTRVFNRPHFERRRQRLSRYALILIDIDNFKHINDAYGHSQGDAVLRAVGERLRTTSGDRVFRVGGEEFAVLLANCAFEDAFGVAERLRETVRGLELLDGCQVTVSAGVAYRGTLDHEAVYRSADKALYHAKTSGRNRVVRFDELVAAKAAQTLAAQQEAAPKPVIKFAA